MANRPAPEIDINEQLVRALLHAQAPEFADLPLSLLDRGWDNTNWRLGDEFIVRVPHRQVAAPLIANEQCWLPRVADRLELAIPVPVMAGSPCPVAEFPWSWSIVPWFEGTELASVSATEEVACAELLGDFLRQLHQPADDAAPVNPYRGIPLSCRRDSFYSVVDELVGRIDVRTVTSVFEDALAAPVAEDKVWLHGDLHSRNIIVNNDVLTAVVDWGDICAGDRATDLAAAFMVAPNHIDIVRSRAGADDAAWQRARGWAIHFALIYTYKSDDDPIQARVGTELLATLSD